MTKPPLTKPLLTKRPRPSDPLHRDPVRDGLPPADLPALNWGLRLLGLLVLAGAFLGGTGTWGFDHLAWLPRWTLAAVLPLVGFLFWIGGPRRADDGLTLRLHGLLFRWRPGVVGTGPGR